MTTRNHFWRSQAWYYLIPTIVLLSLTAIEWNHILYLNGGIFSYALDDAYIHLTMAKNIRAGWYGINPGEMASSSSSILWPFLLTPVSNYSFFEKTPLVLNIIFSLLTLWFFINIILSVRQPATTKQTLILIFLFSMLVFILNLVVLIFIGMEHSLQVFLSVLLMGGLILESKTNHLPPWLALVIILNPLVRYENLALSLPAIIFLFYRKHYKAACLITLFLLVFLALFSLFLHHIGQPLLPASIFAKSGLVLYDSIIGDIRGNLLENLHRISGTYLVLFSLYFISIFFFPEHSNVNKQLSLVIAACFVLQLIFGKIYCYSRYELYLYAAMILWLSYLLYSQFSQLENKRSITLVLFISLILLDYQYIKVAINLPIAANNIFDQQYQMSKFVGDWLKGPVAANDIGLVSYKNPYYVLDLGGIGNTKIFQMRISNRNVTWMNSLTEKSHIKLAMLYKDWFFSMPNNWSLLGCLYLSKQRISPSEKVVHFYATSNEYRAELIKKINQFQKKLPSGVAFKTRC